MPEIVMEIASDTPQVPAKKPANGRSTIWTPEQARLNAAKSAASRKSLAAHRRESIKQAAKQAAANPFQALTAQPATVQLTGTHGPDTFARERLAKVRKQVLKLDCLLSDACDDPELDPGHIDKLASAISRLSEIERQLSDRPLPGSKRPAPEKASQGKASLLLSSPSPESSQAQDQE